MKQIERYISKLKDKKERRTAEQIYKWYLWRLKPEQMRWLLLYLLVKPARAWQHKELILSKAREAEVKRQNE